MEKSRPNTSLDLRKPQRGFLIAQSSSRCQEPNTILKQNSVGSLTNRAARCFERPQRYWGSIFLLLVIGIFFFTSPVLALAPLVPCGGEGQPLCTTCDFLVLGKNISDFILIYLVPAISALLFIYAGFEILLGGGIPARVQQGRNVFQTTVYGLLIIFLSWLIVNTILRTVAGDENIAQNWWKLECRENGSTEVAGNANNELPPNVVDNKNNELPPNVPNALAISGLRADNVSENSAAIFWTTNRPATSQVQYTKAEASQKEETELDTNKTANHTVQITGLAPNTTYTVKAISVDESQAATAEINFKTKAENKIPLRSIPLVPSAPPVNVQPPSNTQTSSSTTLVCKFSGVNLCQASGTCPANTCSQYSSAIQKAAAATPINGLNSVALIRAFMFNESSCNVLAKNTTVSPPSCGLMQLQASTANRFKTQCGITASITCDWLTSPANAEASICIAAKYIKSIAGGTCGGEVRNIAAGYNGGVGACGASNDCKNDKSCDGGTVRKWECLYDSQPAPLHCNTGYDETRAYAPKVQACYNQNK